MRILSQASTAPVALDATLREQGLTSFEAVLVAAALEEYGCEQLDYSALLAATPRQLAVLIPAA